MRPTDAGACAQSWRNIMVPEVHPESFSAPLGARTDCKLVVVGGCPRSGTTWLQLLLAQHPDVATCNETYLFVYIDNLHQRWEQEHRSSQVRSVGLSHVLSGHEFYELCRNFAVSVVTKIQERRPGAQVVMEKDPGNILRGELILRLFPDAYFLHVVRDPRSVVSSLLAAWSGWGKSWAPRSVVTAARRWQEAIEAGDRLAKSTDRYRVVRYESLLSNGPDELAKILSWLELTQSADFPARAIEVCQIDRLRTASAETFAPWALEKEPEAFFRRGEAESWRRELTPSQVRIIEYLLGDLMVGLDYPRETGTRLRKPVAVRAREVYDATEWRFRQWLDALST